ncbi:ATP-binding cassette domain-containing protein [Actinoplanes ianthinogenes]|uniref:ATP-binding cassette domain-containing protein n=1 Tax=Actinoplanes ianthinogenes TaxID=122358 RepID=UPI00166FE014|nr:ATP-binding cassette domain-containing protein [Actinoplanes ianthinogenes]
MARGPVDPRLLRHARSGRAGVALLALIGTGQAAATLAIAVALCWLVAPSLSRSILLGGSRPAAITLLAGAFAARGLLSWAEQVVARRTAARVTDELRRSLLAAIIRRGPAWVASYGAGRLTTILGTGLDALRPWFSGYLPSLVLGVLLPPAVLAVMALVDPASAVIALLTLPLIPLLGALIGWATQARARQRWDADARLAGHFLDVVRGLGTLKIYGRAERQTAVIADLTDQHRRATLRVLRVAFLSSTALDLVGTLSVGLIAVQAGIRVADGSMPLAPALLAILLAPEAYRPLREMAARYHAATDATAVIADVDDILTSHNPPAGPHGPTAPPQRTLRTSPNPPAGLHGPTATPQRALGTSPNHPAGPHSPIATPQRALETSPNHPAGPHSPIATPQRALETSSDDPAGSYGPIAAAEWAVGTSWGSADGTLPTAAGRWGVLAAGVRASYPGMGGDALRLDELSVRAGEVVALRGASGAGKSTALRVFAGLHPADAGAVAVGRAFHLPQRPTLPHARTVGEAFATDAGDEEIRSALRMVGLDREVTPDTPLGEHGNGLSAGQRQRLALAALLHRAGRVIILSRRSADRPHRGDPGPKRRPTPVVTLLLDEPTAHLDPDAERLVVARLREFAQRGCAVLVVAHRPALLTAADRVVTVSPPPGTGPVATAADLAAPPNPGSDTTAAAPDPSAGATRPAGTPAAPDDAAGPDPSAGTTQPTAAPAAPEDAAAADPSTGTTRPAGTPAAPDDAAAADPSTGTAPATRPAATLAAPGDAAAADPSTGATRPAGTPAAPDDAATPDPSTGATTATRPAGTPAAPDDAATPDPSAGATRPAGTPGAAGEDARGPWWRRPWVAAALGAAAVLGGILLTGSAAWLLVRASSLPPVLTLSAAVVLVRGSAVARPLLRYLERLVAHDVAFARLGGRRARVYADLIPRVPGPGLHRRGDLLTRLVDDVDARVDGLLRGWLPAWSALVTVVVAGAAAMLITPVVAAPLAIGVLISGVLAPLLAGWQADRQDAATGVARAALRDAMVETVDGVEELGGGAGRSGVPESRSRTLADLEARAARTAGLAAAVAHLGWAAAAAGTALALAGAGISAEWSAVLVLGVIALGEPLVTLPEAAVARRRAAGAERRVAALTQRVTSPRTSAPKARTTAPEARTTAPEARTTAPKARTTAPEARTTAPEARTAAPEARTSAPDARAAVRAGHGIADGAGDGIADGAVSVSGLVAGWDPAAEPALDGIDLELRPGAKVAITGRSGSGKSTLGAVLGGLLAPRAGDVRVGGKALLVGDETGHVFASTVRENLRLAKPAATDPQLVAALRRVGLGPWLAGLADGLDTWLGTGGSTMSGGQRRRLATARALLADPALLILDEPTEGIDEAGARELMADLLDAASGRTVLVFAHRAEGFDLVDEIYELSSAKLNVGVL